MQPNLKGMAYEFQNFFQCRGTPSAFAELLFRTER